MSHMNMGGERQQWVTGAQRDTDNSKPTFGVIPIWRLELMQRAWAGTRTLLKINRDRPGTDTLKIDEENVRLDLIPAYYIKRLAAWLGLGAKRYGDNNWRKGIPLSRYLESLKRHIAMYEAGDTSEDHLAAMQFNVMGLTVTEADIVAGKTPIEIGDAGWMKPKPALQDMDETEVRKEVEWTRSVLMFHDEYDESARYV